MCARSQRKRSILRNVRLNRLRSASPAQNAPQMGHRSVTISLLGVGTLFKRGPAVYLHAQHIEERPAHARRAAGRLGVARLGTRGAVLPGPAAPPPGAPPAWSQPRGCSPQGGQRPQRGPAPPLAWRLPGKRCAARAPHVLRGGCASITHVKLAIMLCYATGARAPGRRDHGRVRGACGRVAYAAHAGASRTRRRCLARDVQDTYA
jgi:hypothetical protein